MSQHQFSGGNIRKLWPTETDKFRDHLLRLDKMSRRLRFAHGVSDAFIEDYAGRTDSFPFSSGFLIRGRCIWPAEWDQQERIVCCVVCAAWFGRSVRPAIARAPVSLFARLFDRKEAGSPRGRVCAGLPACARCSSS